MNNKEQTTISFNDAFGVLGDIIKNINSLPIKVSSFDSFVQDIFALSYPQYDFNTWHIRKMCTKIDEILNNTKSEKYLLGGFPRYHLKSTILGYALTIYRMLTSVGDGLYISYKDELAQYHASNIKTSILNNPVLSRFFIDLHPQSDTALGFRIGQKRVRVFTTGIFSMKRGLHTDLITVADDILGDLVNPMALDELKKVENIFNAEIINIPNQDCPLIVFGTAIDYSDILFKLKSNPQFEVLWMPAFNPDEKHEVLWEKKYDKKWLENRKASSGWKAFSAEFMLTPIISTEAFFSREDIDSIIDSSLKNLSLFRPITDNYKCVVAGFDIGKRRNPSHLAIFAEDEFGKLKMLHQSFWDNMDYIEQVSRLEIAIENFKIDKMYIDNTRGEMEDRGLPRQCIPIKFTHKGIRNQMSFATGFAKIVEGKKISIIDDDRYISQLLSVTNTLKARETPEGHGDSFWSSALAVGVYDDYFAPNKNSSFAYLGNLQESVNKDVKKRFDDPNVCKICGKFGIQRLEDNRIKCDKCFAIYEE